MTTNNGNGFPPKVELKLGQEVKLKILRDVKTGKNGRSNYYLYRVADLDSGEEMSLFAEPNVHEAIQSARLGPGSEFLLKRMENGTKGSTKLELSILAKAPEPTQPNGDDYKQLLLRCIRDANDIVKEAGIQFSNDELQKLATTLFIQRTKLA